MDKKIIIRKTIKIIRRHLPSKDRNNAVHTYNESLAKEIYGKINDYIILFEELKNAL